MIMNLIKKQKNLNGFLKVMTQVDITNIDNRRSISISDRHEFLYL